MLEKVARESAGVFVLVKADTEALPDITSAFGGCSIRAVFSLRDGKVVDAFRALPEAEVRAWVNRHLRTAAERAMAEARGLEGTDPEAAEGKYRSVLESSPNDLAARAGLGG